MPLTDKKLVKRLISSGIRSFDIPVYGHNAFIHDKIVGVKGSFKKLTEAIENLKAYEDIDLHLHTILLRQNIRVISSLMDWMRMWTPASSKFRLAAPRTRLVSDYKKYCPSFEQIVYYLKEQSHFIKPEMFMSRFPVCILQAIFGSNTLAQILYMRTLDSKKGYLKIDSFETQYLKKTSHPEFSGFTKGPVCSKCTATSFCKGVYQSYAQLYGYEELKAIRRNRP